MEPAIIVGILGFLGAVVTAIGWIIAAYIEKRPRKAFRIPPEKAAKIKRITGRLFFAAVALIIVYYLLPKGPVVQITAPARLAEVSVNEMVQGISEHISLGGQVMWVIIYPHEARGCYYPQDTPVHDIQPDGDWAYPAVIGTQGDAGSRFDIIVALVSKEGQEILNDYLAEAGGREEWAGICGMQGLPAGVTEQDRVTVIRK